MCIRDREEEEDDDDHEEGSKRAQRGGGMKKMSVEENEKGRVERAEESNVTSNTMLFHGSASPRLCSGRRPPLTLPPPRSS
eukprot:3971057-Pyramimonas_sp.AAC.1